MSILKPEKKFFLERRILSRKGDMRQIRKGPGLGSSLYTSVHTNMFSAAVTASGHLFGWGPPYWALNILSVTHANNHDKFLKAQIKCF